jgi:Mn-dependent DtxR family transcriptional regulator
MKGDTLSQYLRRIYDLCESEDNDAEIEQVPVLLKVKSSMTHYLHYRLKSEDGSENMINDVEDFL